MRALFFPESADAAERALFARVAAWDGPPGFEALTPESLRELTAREGCDFATALLHRRAVESAVHGPFLRRLCADPIPAPRQKPLVAIVPAAFYRENPRTGADGRLPREVAASLGLPTRVVPLASTGRLADNARTLAEWLLTLGNQPVILVSLSKGGGEVKAALARPDAAERFGHVLGWVNLCGILDGTPMADWLLSPAWVPRVNRFVYRIRGRSLDFLDDLRPGPDGPLAAVLTLPPGLRAFHVIGFPLSTHFHNGLARRCHARLAADGPNDGSVPLAAAPGWPGQLCPVWGADHYLRPRVDVRPLLAALFGHLAA